MKESIKAIVLFPLVLGVTLALIHRALGGWKYAAALEWVLFLGLMAGVWVPVILLPYVRRTGDDR
jgi:uncharacterized membrane protein